MNDDPDKFLEARIGDMYSRAERDLCCVYSAFLDERQCTVAEKICQSAERGNYGTGIGHEFWGGYKDAQRKILCVYSDYCRDNVLRDIPIRCVTFTFRDEDKLSHRDFLGSFMALRLKREAVGDIIIAEGKAQAFVTDNAADLIIQLISKIGKTGVRVSGDEVFSLDNRQNFAEIPSTVSSLRLDCIVSAAAGLSRENSAKLIRCEKVSVNYLVQTSVSKEISEGDVITIRGSGKYILDKIKGETKKGRTHVVILKYK